MAIEQDSRHAIYGKNLFQNQKSFEAEFWCIVSGTRGLSICLNDGRRMTFLQQICALTHLYGENVEKSFSHNLLKTNSWNLQCMIKVV